MSEYVVPEVKEAVRILRGLIEREFNPATAPYRLSNELYELWLSAQEFVGRHE